MEEKFKTYEKPVLEIERAEGEKTVQERVEDLISNRLPSDNMDSAIMRQQMTQFLDNFMQTRQMTGEVLQAQQNAISEKDEEIARLKTDQLAMRKKISEMESTGNAMRTELETIKAQMLEETSKRKKKAVLDAMQARENEKNVRNRFVIEFLTKMRDYCVNYYQECAQIDENPDAVEYWKPLHDVADIFTESILEDRAAYEEARSNCKAIRVLSKLAYKQEKKRLQQPDFQQGGNTYIFNGGDNVVGKVETGHVNQVNIASTDIKH